MDNKEIDTRESEMTGQTRQKNDQKVIRDQENVEVVTKPGLGIESDNQHNRM